MFTLITLKLKPSQSLEGVTIFSEGWDRFLEVIRKTWRCLHLLHTHVRPCLRTTNYMIPMSTTCDHLIHCKIVGAGIYKCLTALFKSLACTVACEDKIFKALIHYLKRSRLSMTCSSQQKIVFGDPNRLEFVIVITDIWTIVIIWVPVPNIFIITIIANIGSLFVG